MESQMIPKEGLFQVRPADARSILFPQKRKKKEIILLFF